MLVDKAPLGMGQTLVTFCSLGNLFIFLNKEQYILLLLGEIFEFNFLKLREAYPSRSILPQILYLLNKR